MKYDGKIDIATGHSAKTRTWKNKTVIWSELVAKLRQPKPTNETYKEFISASKDDQFKIKDVGGYVGGYLRNGKRSPKSVVYRQLLTLDIDFGHADFWDDFTLSFGCAAICHGTHKWHPDDPRLRLIIPLDREVTPDEYAAIARRVAGDIGIDLFDNTTFEVNRLMFWQSSPRDIDYYYESQDGPWLSADDMLARYADWTDTSTWPVAGETITGLKDQALKQQHPHDKKGLIGLFCQTYTIAEAIDKFLEGVYVPAFDDRYTYVGGSTAAGLITYDDVFAFSHHGTDPASGQLCNAFDLVRLHKFEGTKDSTVKQMLEFAAEQPEVKQLIASRRLDDAKYDFQDLGEVETESEDNNFMALLEVDGKGRYTSTANNLNLIFAHDPRLKKGFRFNQFDGKAYVFKTLPWRRVDRPEVIKNVDYAGVRNYLESIYGITGLQKIDDALTLEIDRNSYHPVKDYLGGLTWDGVERLDSLLIDYMGAVDNLYTREAIRKALVGAVARIYKPGVKFDLVLTLVGSQGTGKSTLIKKLGGPWFSDTFLTVNGKEALEQIQGAWLIEMAELSGLRKADVEAVKHFISKQEDTFRPAYARVSETYRRQCVFFGTTNTREFLSDPTGNRRFLPVDINPGLVIDDVFSAEFDKEIDQIWAEAVNAYREGESLTLSKEAQVIANAEQAKHVEQDSRKGVIADYLEIQLPINYEDLDIHTRRLYLETGDATGETYIRDKVCVAAIWCECLGKDKADMSRYNTKEINEIMRNLEGWTAGKGTLTFNIYGKQRYYERCN